MAISKITGSALGKDVIMKDVATADGSSPTLTLQTGDTNIEADDVLGSINFQAPDEGTGTDAILVAAGISAVSEGDFSSSNNATKLSFRTGASETATEKMTISSTGATTITTADNNPQLILVCTDTDASTGPKLELNRNPGEAGADGDNLGQIEFYGYNDASQKSQYAYIFAEAADVADGSEDVRFGIGGLVAGADSSLMTFMHGTSATGADPEMVFNDTSRDINFRVESDNDANAFFVEGSSGNVGIGTNSPNAVADLHVADTSDARIWVEATSGDTLELYAGTGVGVFNRSNSHLIFGTSNAEKARIDSSGLFMIGTTTEGHAQADNLTVAGSGHTGITIRSTDSNETAIFFSDATSGTGEYIGAINYIHSDNSMRFSVNVSERMRIDSSGNVFINTLNDMGGILNTSHADGVAIGSANDQTYYRRIYGTAGANLELRFWNGSNEGSLNSSGAWVNASDVSLKENIADIEYGIDTVKSLKPRKYTMKEGGNSEVGFIAQEMESVVPEVVNTSENPDGDEIKGISYGQLNAVLTKALQEAIAKIETLETKVAALEDA